jgi:catechol 2,3-dioxygenase-like lactoylglutathione lyase family enzyme
VSRIQLALHVDDLDESVAFYRRLFDTEPAKVRPGYANFAVADPPLKLVLIENAGHGGTLNHLGVEVDDTAAVDDVRRRLETEGLGARDERGVTCCYATQDKFWVEETPNAERWEVYTVLADSPTASAVSDDASCCCAAADVQAPACCAS